MALRIVKNDEGPSPDEFRIPASDTKGHSARMWFQAVPTMVRRVEEVVQSKKFPYRTMGDLLRHALHRHMHWLEKMDGTIISMGQVDIALEVLRDEEYNSEFRSVFGRLEARVAQHLAEGAKSEAIRLVLTINNHIQRMPDGFWKERYRSELRTKYGDLLGKGELAKLGEME